MKHLLLKPVFTDIFQGLRSWRIWMLLGWEDIHLRYRRSTLGPFWITLSMAALVYSMGFLYGKLFNADLTTYYPFIATGIVTWTFIASVINDSTETLLGASEFIQQIKLPFSIYILRMLTNNLIIFFHNFLAIIPILIFFNVPFTLTSISLFLFNLFLLVICGFCYGFILSLFGTRFRDIKPIITSLLQIFFLLTPILWMPAMLTERYFFFAAYNPFFHLVDLLRAPLTGGVPHILTYAYVGLIILLGFTVMVFLLWRTRHRIAFWL